MLNQRTTEEENQIMIIPDDLIEIIEIIATQI